MTCLVKYCPHLPSCDMPEGRAAGIPESESSDPSFPANSCAILNAVVSSVLLVTFKFKVVFLWVLILFFYV